MPHVWGINRCAEGLEPLTCNTIPSLRGFCRKAPYSKRAEPSPRFRDNSATSEMPTITKASTQTRDLCQSLKSEPPGVRFQDLFRGRPLRNPNSGLPVHKPAPVPVQDALPQILVVRIVKLALKPPFLLILLMDCSKMI